MAYNLNHLHSAWDVDRTIILEEEKIVIIRFGSDDNPSCVKMDKILYKAEYEISLFASIYLVDVKEVPEFNTLYELYDPCSVIFFYRNKRIQVDFGTGDNNKLNFPLDDVQEFIDIVEVVYEGASKGKGLVVSPKDYSIKRKY